MFRFTFRTLTIFYANELPVTDESKILFPPSCSRLGCTLTTRVLLPDITHLQVPPWWDLMRL